MNKEYRLFCQSREVVKSFLDTITEENYYPGLSVHFSIIAGHWLISSKSLQIETPQPEVKLTEEEKEKALKEKAKNFFN